MLIHEYFRIDLELAWAMVQKDVPELASNVQRTLDDLEDRGVPLHITRRYALGPLPGPPPFGSAALLGPREADVA